MNDRLSFERKQEPEHAQVPAWLWWGTVGLLATTVFVGIALAVAMALGWRSPTPHRVPDWTASDLTWSQYSDGLTSLTEAGYHIRLTQPGQRAWAIAAPWLTDFDVELTVRSLIPSEDVGYGLLFRYQKPGNYYVFGIGSDGYYTIALVQQGDLRPLRPWQQFPHIRRGVATNQLRVRCRGTSCRFYVNGETTGEIIDDTFLAGNLGLWAESYSDDRLEVLFEELRVWSLERELGSLSVQLWGEKQ